jgi:hypothetical protein
MKRKITHLLERNDVTVARDGVKVEGVSGQSQVSSVQSPWIWSGNATRAPMFLAYQRAAMKAFRYKRSFFEKLVKYMKTWRNVMP